MKYIKFILIWLLAISSLTSSSQITVTNANDSGPGSLRDAINQANSIAGPDVINFNIPGSMVHVINVLTQLPALTDPAGCTIDGYSQSGASMGAQPPSTATLMIELNGFAAGPSHGLVIVSSNNVIQGLIINRFEQDGIRIEGTLEGTQANSIFGNFIGTDFSGTVPLGNGSNQASPWAGVNIVVGPCGQPLTCFNNFVNANLCSGNYAEGISLSSCPPGDVFDNNIVDNFCGTDITGLLDLGNDHCGVYIGEGAHDNEVINNVLSGNDYEGVSIVGYVDEFLTIFTNDNEIISNNIGLGSDGITAVGNTRDGVSVGIYGPTWLLGHALNNQIVDNDIAHNGRNGIVVYEHPNDAANVDGTFISANRIHSNALLGIDLDDNGVTINDIGDNDTGANEEVNYPLIQNVEECPDGQVLITGVLSIDTDPTLANVEIYVSDNDPSGHGEGQIFIASTTPNSSGGWSAYLTGIPAGSIMTAMLTDVNGNSSEFSPQVSIIAPMMLSIIPQDVNCFGEANGSVDFSVSGGSGFYNYSWSSGQITQDIDNVPAGTYTVTVTDLWGCSGTIAATVDEPDQLDMSANVTNASCNGDTNGSIDLIPLGGTSPYTFDWSNGGTTEDISSLEANTYDITITDSHNCEAEGSYAVTEPDELIVDATVEDVSCFGDEDGSIESIVSGGTSPYTYEWSNDETSEDIEELAAGTFSLTITDDNDCEATNSFNIIEPDELTVSSVVVDESCEGCEDGSIEISIDGGTPDYDIEWSNDETTEMITDLSAGIYCVDIEDANGCSAELCDTVYAIVSVNELIHALSELNVYPNPFNNQIQISFYLSEAQRINISIFDISGKLIEEIRDEKLVRGEHIISWNNSGIIEKGVYLMVLETDQSREVLELIKQ